VEGVYGIAIHINPDTIAAGFGAASMDSVAFDAGRIALSAVDDCIRRGVDFAFETTLSGRRWPRLLNRLGAADYDVFLHYLWIPDASQCVARVAQRVAVGGHGVREEDIRRRHGSSIENCITVFMPRVHEWFVYDGSKGGGLNIIASGERSRLTRVVDLGAWMAFTAGGRRDIVREVAARYSSRQHRRRVWTMTSPRRSVPATKLPWIPARTSGGDSRVAYRGAQALAFTEPSASGPLLGGRQGRVGAARRASATSTT
jgi:predicted ABC-type ATPase